MNAPNWLALPNADTSCGPAHNPVLTSLTLDCAFGGTHFPGSGGSARTCDENGSAPVKHRAICLRFSPCTALTSGYVCTRTAAQLARAHFLKSNVCQWSGSCQLCKQIFFFTKIHSADLCVCCERRRRRRCAVGDAMRAGAPAVADRAPRTPLVANVVVGALKDAITA